jgi:peptidoglycan/xylan/chitin deacetylase (PgdA/CDA1 family)
MVVVFGMICLAAGAADSDPATDFVPRTGFVTLQFDDSHDLHYTHIFPLLEAHGFKGTFGYVTESSDLGIEHEAWKMQEIYQAGHEVQDHTTRHNYLWASHVDTVNNGQDDWIEWTFTDSAGWDSLCERSLFILDSLGIEVVGWNYPGGGTFSVPGHPDWRWLGAINDTMYSVIGNRYPYALGYGCPPPTAHLNLRGHNRPDRFPFFSVPHVTIDYRSMEEIKTGIADAVAAGLWYLAVGHVTTVDDVDRVDSLVQWLDEKEVEVLTCYDGWQRIEFGQPDPLVNQLPQAEMLVDLDQNNKPDGFTGLCAWDTVTVSPVANTKCLRAFGQTEFCCYGPEEGISDFSMWLKSAGQGPDTIPVVIARVDFDWTWIGHSWTRVIASDTWTKIDNSMYPNFTVSVENEVDRIAFRIKVAEGDTVLVAYPEFLYLPQSGLEALDRDDLPIPTCWVSPNPVRRGIPLQVWAGGRVEVYDVLGRRLFRYDPCHRRSYVTIDTSLFGQGVYFLTAEPRGENPVKVIVY